MVRPYEHGDLTGVLRLWERTGCVPRGADGLTVDEAVALMGAAQVVTLVAERDGEIVGMGAATAAAVIGRLHRLTVLAEQPPGVADELLAGLEQRLAESGVRRVETSLAPDSASRAQLERRGYSAREYGLHLEHELPAPVAGDLLAELGGRLIGPGLWDELRGLEEAKEIIERRVILPLAEPVLARRHSVASPKAIVLFGPPGTGKTTFAKGIASRLGWPFVEIEPRQVGEEGPERQVRTLAGNFDALLDLSSVVAFIDEVEDIAAVRDEERRVSPSVTNELLRQIPRLREAPEHLLVCATNWVGRLDPAFLRPGRFDYVLPVGPPDRDARAAIWERYVEEITDETVDVPALVDATELFTPADIEFAARKGAQRAFEREHFEGVHHRATTDEFLAAIRATRPTLTPEVVKGFEEDTQRLGRY